MTDVATNINSVTGWLLRAAAGDVLVPGAGTVTSLLASAAAGSGLAVDGLDCGQVVRAMLHAAAAAKQAEALLLEVQSATAIYPATVALVLQALSSAQRQQLADTLLNAAQQQQQQQQQQQYLQERVQAPAWVQQLHQLSTWDVLLLLGLWGQPQWEADAGMVLLQGVRDMPSLQDLSQLLVGLASTCSDAAAWLLGVGLMWASTCHLDMGEQGSWFNEAGVWLLKAAVVASPRLAGQSLSSVVQQLTAEGSICTPLWQVLQYSVAKCVSHHNPQQPQQEPHAQQQRKCTVNMHNSSSSSSGGSNSTAGMGSAAAAVAHHLLAALPAVLQQPHPDIALRYIRTIGPLAAVSCTAGPAMLAAAAVQLQQQRHGPQAGVHDQRALDLGQLQVKQETQQGAELQGCTAAAAAAVAALAGEASGQQQQQQLDVSQRKPRYSWGEQRGYSSQGIAGSSSLAARQHGSRGAASPPGSAAAVAALAAGGGGRGAAAALPHLPPAPAPQLEAAAAAECSGVPAAPVHETPLATPVAGTDAQAQHRSARQQHELGQQQQQQHNMQLLDPQRRSARLSQLLARAAASTARSSSSSSSSSHQAATSCAVAELAGLPAAEQRALALAAAVLRRGMHAAHPTASSSWWVVWLLC
ncbi:hypothetical protein COO60DRAFT_643902 [Scenedesmus sp. NREL 46B-D3]|nr:hypothetical protein COO60DRAFT_643902 [Scenedesmus sp. NREL 46B-D3]